MKPLKQYWTSPNGVREATNYIVIHHAAWIYPDGQAVQSIYNYHKSRWPGYEAIGYHIVCQQEADKSIRCYLVNPPDMQGAGVWGQNHQTFHICAATNFDNRIPDQRWINAMNEAVAYAKGLYPNATVVGHKDITLPGHTTTCPGLRWHQWRKLITGNIMADIPIIGHSNIAGDVMYRAIRKWGGGISEDRVWDLIHAYTAYGQLTNIGNLYPFSQAAKETAWFTSVRFLENNNPAGLGATNDGASGAVFQNVMHGVLAQYAHLLCYATENAGGLEPLTDLSPRKTAMVNTFGRGSAKTWTSLNGKWAWPGTDYGESIIKRAELIKDS